MINEQGEVCEATLVSGFEVVGSFGLFSLVLLYATNELVPVKTVATKHGPRVNMYTGELRLKKRRLSLFQALPA